MNKVFPLCLVFVLFLLTGCGGGTSTEYPLAEPGPYHVGVIKMVRYVDDSRGGKEIFLTIWYPSSSELAKGTDPLPDAPPDMAGGPYPLIISSTKNGTYYAPIIVSHGFAYMGVNSQDSKPQWGEWLIDYPLDILFGFQQLAKDPPAGFEGVFDTDNVGAMGYSFDSFTTLVLGGARFDPEYYLDKCEDAKPKEPFPPEWWIDYICAPANDWQAFTDHAGAAITTSSDGLWQPITDERIKAVIPMGPEGAWMFGPRGLAAVQRPVLIFGATEDDINFYDFEAVQIYQNLEVDDKAMISFVGQDHMMVFNSLLVTQMQHFAIAFFGYHLQGNEAYADLFSKDFVRQHAGLDWGIH